VLLLHAVNAARLISSGSLACIGQLMANLFSLAYLTNF
jgi:hypothetical protein